MYIYMYIYIYIYIYIYLINQSHHQHEQFTSLFYMLFRMYNMEKTSDAHLNAKLCT